MKSCSYIQRNNYVAHSIINKFDILSPIAKLLVTVDFYHLRT